MIKKQKLKKRAMSMWAINNLLKAELQWRDTENDTDGVWLSRRTVTTTDRTKLWRWGQNQHME